MKQLEVINDHIEDQEEKIEEEGQCGLTPDSCTESHPDHKQMDQERTAIFLQKSLSNSNLGRTMFLFNA